MNNKIIGIIVAVVIVALAAFFLLKGKSSQNNNEVAGSAANANTQANANLSASEQSSLKGLLADGKNHKCTFSDTNAGVLSQGTVYVASGKMRGDFDVTTQSKTEHTHMIVDGQTSYVWMDSLGTGFKMKFDASAQANANANAQAQSVDPNKNYNFHCDNTTADSSMFKLPANVQFTDMTSMTVPGASGNTNGSANANVNAGAGANAQAAAACAKLSEPARTQCMASISAH